MDAASIEEINKVRRAMGMKPLPVPGATDAPRGPSPDKDQDIASTLETREAAAYDNFRKLREAEEAKKRREEKAAAVKKARDKAQRFATLEGRGLADLDDEDDLDAKSWLKTQKKRQKKIEAVRKLDEEKAAADAAAQHTADNLAGVKVAHDMASFLDGNEQILTLKDTGVLENEEEGDELENLSLREQEKLQERLDLKKKKPLYDPNDIDETAEHVILSKYDEEIDGKKRKVFTLEGAGISTELADILDAPVQRRKRQAAGIEVLEDAPPQNPDYLDASEVKVKKPKKKKSKTTRQRRADDEDALFAGDLGVTGDDQEMDVDSGAVIYTKKKKVFDDNLLDDEDLQASLAMQRKEALKKRKKTRPEDIARQLREEGSQSLEPEFLEGDKGMVIDEISGFVDALNPERLEERKAAKAKAVTEMQDESSDDEEMADADTERESVDRDRTPHADISTGVEEEKLVGQGMAATLGLLKDRHLIEDTNGSELNEKFRQKQKFLAELHRRMTLFDEEARHQRERDRASGRLDKLSIREREEISRQQNTMREQHQSRVMDQLFREGYRPNVELRYVDDDGRSLDAKEAFKDLSHKFHGKGSGKGKTDKRLKRLAEEKRRMAQSMLDASQNVGMSTAASHQGKKRKEAGVRLA